MSDNTERQFGETPDDWAKRTVKQVAKDFAATESDNTVAEPCCMGTAVYRDKSRCTCAASTSELDISAIEAHQHCPNPHCGDRGFSPREVDEGDYEQEQCEFCYTVSDSWFNVRAALLAEVKRLRAELKERNAAA